DAVHGTSVEKEAFGARLALENADVAVHEGEYRRKLGEQDRDPHSRIGDAELGRENELKKQLVEDFFHLMSDYIGGANVSDDEIRQRVDQYCNMDAQSAGITINGTRFSLRDRIATYPELSTMRSQLAVIGTNMRRQAEYYRNNHDRFVTEGIVT